MGRKKERVQPTCVRWQPLQRHRAAPAICSRCVRGVWKAEMAAVWVPAKATSGRNVGKIRFFTQPSQGGWRKNGENKKEDEKLGGSIKKKKDRWIAEQSGANYFTPLVSPEGFVGSEVQPRCCAEDCIWLNCAVVFNTTLNGGILGYAWGTRC